MNEIEFVKKHLMNDPEMYNAYRIYNNCDDSFEESIDALLDYCFYSEFNPYLDEKYLDCCWLCDESTGLIYNLDDMFEVYMSVLRGE